MLMAVGMIYRCTVCCIKASFVGSSSVPGVVVFDTVVLPVSPPTTVVALLFSRGLPITTAAGGGMEELTLTVGRPIELVVTVSVVFGL